MVQRVYSENKAIQFKTKKKQKNGRGEWLRLRVGWYSQEKLSELNTILLLFPLVSTLNDNNDIKSINP